MKNFQNEEELDTFYDEEKERIMKIYLAEREAKKDEKSIQLADKKYNESLRKLISEYQSQKVKIITSTKKKKEK